MFKFLRGVETFFAVNLDFIRLVNKVDSLTLVANIEPHTNFAYLLSTHIILHPNSKLNFVPILYYLIIANHILVERYLWTCLVPSRWVFIAFIDFGFQANYEAI